MWERAPSWSLAELGGTELAAWDEGHLTPFPPRLSESQAEHTYPLPVTSHTLSSKHLCFPSSLGGLQSMCPHPQSPDRQWKREEKWGGGGQEDQRKKGFQGLGSQVGWPCWFAPSLPEKPEPVGQERELAAGYGTPTADHGGAALKQHQKPSCAFCLRMARTL